MERHRQRLALPFRDPANFAPILLESGCDEPRLEVSPLSAAPNNEQLLKRDDSFTRDDFPAVDGVPPRLATEPEAPQALISGETLGVDRSLDLLPVVAPGKPWIGSMPEAPDVIGDSGLRDRQLSRNLGLRSAVGK